ncbi:MAG TPA: hypothetical protein VMY06_12750 [Sedimentisphaerales bacterium]|nr:hypothetical protein [Sedimentisphaerales bacterium]
MLKSRALSVFLAIILCCIPARAQGTLDSEQLSSSSVGKVFYEIAYELANSADITADQAEQAIILLTATMNLDRSAKYVSPVLIKVACQHSQRDHSELVYSLLTNYVGESTDLEPARIAIRYLLGELDSREQREKLLQDMLKNLGGRNAVLDSELATSLALLMAEKAELQSAQSYLIQAYNDNKYNRPAFAKLTELMPGQLSIAAYLEHLRLALVENPADLEAALIFAQYVEQLQLYETAAGAYEYCADLFRYLHPSQPLPARVYIPWAISNYNTLRNPHKCLQIAEQVRQDGQFDLLLEAIAGKAAMKTGNAELAARIFQAAEEKVYSYLVNRELNEKTQAARYKQLAWFYCFALPVPNNALNWANKAYSIDPNSPTTAALLAYSLMMNEQTEWAKLLTGNYQRNQIADLALAQIQLSQGEKDSAIKSLKSAITRDPGSLAAERAKEILAQQGGEYIPPVDIGTTLAVVKNSFGQALVPTFLSPEKMISVRLNLRGSKFSYGSELDGTVAIKNNSSQPLVVSDDGLFKGNIRIDAAVSGALNRKIPNLVSVGIGPPSPIKPGHSIVVPVHLLTGELRQILFTYPQASLDIEFTVYLDSAGHGWAAEDKPTNRLGRIKPAKVLVKRAGIELTGKYLRNRISSLTKGRIGQKIKTAQLLTGLLMEQHAIADGQPPYKLMSADWMPALLRSSLIHNLTRDNWVAKVHTMAGMLSLPLDYELTSVVAQNLNDTHWPARMMAIYLLAKSPDGNFDKVLDWTAKYDSSKLVRDMAIALGAAKAKPEEPANPPAAGELKSLLQIGNEQ